MGFLGTGGKKKEKWKPDDAYTASVIKNVGTAPALQQPIDENVTNIFNWMNRKGQYAGKSYDVTDLPGFGAYKNIYDVAAQQAAEDRVGNPLAAFSKGANPMFANQLASLRKNQRYDTRAAGLNQSVNDILNSAYNLAGQSIAGQDARNATMAGLTMQQARDYFGRPKEPSGFDKFLNTLGKITQIGSGAAAMAFGA